MLLINIYLNDNNNYYNKTILINFIYKCYYQYISLVIVITIITSNNIKLFIINVFIIKYIS